ncbi:MAG TPA: DUF951 domain-containing protein [Chloroflexota bacterium]|nr:DUF951 domain-containing protein [Chloroflexota bacterium]
MRPPTEFRLGDRIEMRKPHPCGGREWDIVRLGADIGFRCRTCGRRVLLERADAERRVKKFVERGPEA